MPKNTKNLSTISHTFSFREAKSIRLPHGGYVGSAEVQVLKGQCIVTVAMPGGLAPVRSGIIMAGQSSVIRLTNGRALNIADVSVFGFEGAEVKLTF